MYTGQRFKGFEGWICVLIASVPDLWILLTFKSTSISVHLIFRMVMRNLSKVKKDIHSNLVIRRKRQPFIVFHQLQQSDPVQNVFVLYEDHIHLRASYC